MHEYENMNAWQKINGTLTLLVGQAWVVQLGFNIQRAARHSSYDNSDRNSIINTNS